MIKRIILIALLVLAPVLSYGAEKFGMVFDMQGKVELQNPDGKILKLQKQKHILHPVNEGDKVKVGKDGMVLIVSQKDSKGYKMPSNSIAVIRNQKLESLKGKITTAEGLRVPSRGDNEASVVGGMVLRGGGCVKLKSPDNTAILERAPRLFWENGCAGQKNVIVRVLDEKGDTLINMETASNSVKIPENKLSYGAVYKWLIYDTNSQSSSWTTFTIPEEGKIKSITDTISQYERHKNDLPQRLSFVFYLLENNLRQAAEKEIGQLNNEFPENDYLKRLSSL